MDFTHFANRTNEPLPDGRVKVTVTPPLWSGFKRGASLILTADQFARYERWRTTGGYIQNLLPELSDGEREILLSGIQPNDWDKAFGDE